MSLETLFMLLEKGTGLTPAQIKLLIRTGWVALVSVHMLWVCGLLTTVGLTSPFAAAAEAESLKDNVSEIKVQLLEQSLLEARLRQCKAETPDSKQYYFERLQEKMNAYYNLTKRNYPIPACAEVQ